MRRQSLLHFTLLASLAASQAGADETLILSAVQPGAEASITAISRHPLVKKVQPVFGEPEKQALKALGQGLTAQSLKITVADEMAAKRLTAWAKSSHAKVVLESNATATANEAGDPLTHYQWGLSNNGASQGTDLDDITTLDIPGIPGEDVGLLRAPREATIGRPIRIAILDSGIDLTHPDLIDQIMKKPGECAAVAAYKACQAAAGSNAAARTACDASHGAVDSDGNGYPLDCNGWNVTSGRQGPTGVLGDFDPTDSIGHGTHVAGIIGAGSNGIGVLGAISNAQLIPVRVIDKNPNPPLRPQDTTQPAPAPSPGEANLQWTSAFADVIARGMLYAIRNEAQVINMSLAWPLAADSILMRRMVKLAQERGILIVASAGNDSNDAQVMPCAYPGVVCVAAHGPDGALSHFSNFGPAVDVAAPGLKILSTWPMNKRALAFTERPGYEFKNGTSMASPLVAGLLARLLNDGFTPQEAYARLILSARQSRPNGFRNAAMAQKSTRSGNVDIAAAYRVSPQPLILPASKDLIRIAWDRQTAEVPVSFTLKNNWAASSGAVRIEARIADTVPGARFAQLSDAAFSAASWASGAEKTFSTRLRILDPRVDGRLTIELSVQSGTASRIIQIPIEITVPVTPSLRDRELQSYPIDGQIIAGSSFRTVTANTRDSRNEYLAIKRGTQWDLQLVTEEATRYRVSASAQIAPLEGELYLVNRLDAENAGKDTYVFILRLNPAAGTTGRRFAFHFFDSRLQAQGSMIYDNSSSTLSERFQWLKQVEAGVSRMVPAWVALGTTPPLEQPDRSNDPWGLIEEDTEKFRFYYLDREGKLRSIAAPEGYSFVEALSASDEQRANGEVPVLLSKGTGYQVTYHRAIVRGKQVTGLEALRFGSYRNLQAAGTVQEVIGLGQSSSLVGTAFSGIGVSGSQRTTLIPASSSQVSFDASQSPMNSTESVVRVAGVFMGSRSAGVFSQTFYELQFHDLSSGQVANTSLNRFSFMPAFIQQKSFFPIVVGNQQALYGERLPAMLVPSGLGDTLANEVIVPATDSSGRLGLSRPARLRFEDTAECTSLGKPRLATSEAATQIVFFCGDRFMRTTLNY